MASTAEEAKLKGEEGEERGQHKTKKTRRPEIELTDPCFSTFCLNRANTNILFHCSWPFSDHLIESNQPLRACVNSQSEAGGNAHFSLETISNNAVFSSSFAFQNAQSSRPTTDGSPLSRINDLMAKNSPSLM